ncbi:MAG: hypothetical protein JW717_14090 [Marinilabiliaceae bacterium]|nr:hypothetical protein [Marinilabiliaceae bacterium]
MFSVDAKVGVYPLLFDLSGSSESQTLTIYAGESNMNYIISDGAIEILSIDSVSNVVTGRIDAFSEDETFVNGNFEATFCR